MFDFFKKKPVSLETGKPLPIEAAPVVAIPVTPAIPAAAGKLGWRERLKSSLFAVGIGGLFAKNPKLDENLLDEIETALISADVGVKATTEIVQKLRHGMKVHEFADAHALLKTLRQDLLNILLPIAKPLSFEGVEKPFVILTVGVNGVAQVS